MGSFSLPERTEIGEVTLRVVDLEEMVTYYEDVLGLTKIGEPRDWVDLGVREKADVLVRLVPGATGERNPARTAGLFHMAFRVPNRRVFATVVRRILSKSDRIEGSSDHGVSEAFYLADPEGNGIEVYWDRPKDEWPREGDEIAMTTRPLHLRRLLSEESSDAESASGLPEQTRIGHLHLQVADLERSKQFYHELLGFGVTQESYPGALFLAAGDYHHHVGLNVWRGEDLNPNDPELSGLAEFEVRVPSQRVLDLLRERVGENGTPSTGEDADLRLQDPDGNRLRFTVVQAGRGTTGTARSRGG